MSFLENNKQNILYAVCILIILTVFLPYYSITSEGNVSSSYGGASASISFVVRGVSLGSFLIIPLLAMLTMYFIYSESRYTSWGFAILSIISIAYLTHIIGVSSETATSSAHSSIGDYSVSATANAKSTASASYGLLLFFILSILGYYFNYTLYSSGNANIKLIKVLYVLSIIISVLSFLSIFVDLSLAEDFVKRGRPYPQEAIISIIGAIDIILLWPILRLVLLKTRLQLLEEQDDFILEDIERKKKIIKVLSITSVIVMSILILYSCSSNSVHFF
jgi:hypothetical protein